MSLEYAIAYVSIGSVLIPLLIAIAHWKKMDHELKLLGWILIISLSSDMISFILVHVGLNTLFVVNMFLFAQFSLLVAMMRKQLRAKRVIDIAYLLFLAFYMANIIFFQGPWVFNSVSNVFASLILIALCVYYFYKLLNDLPTIHIHSLPMLWITFAVMTYYAGNFFLFLIGNYLLEGGVEQHKMVWILHNLLNIVKNILFAIALWQSYHKARSSTLSSSAH